MTSSPNASAPLTIITGASSGIGRELALVAAARGDALLLVARGREALEQVATDARAAGSPFVETLSADLGSVEGAEQVAARARELPNPTTNLLNNAGYGVWGEFAKQDVDKLAGMVDLNDRAIVLLTRHVIEDVVAAKGGIMTLASTASFQPGPGMAVYHASKAFALYFSLALREELRGTGARATAVCPGPVPTGFQERAKVTDMKITRIAELPADKVAQIAWRALDRNRPFVIPGATNRVGALAAKLTPIRLSTRVARSALGAM